MGARARVVPNAADFQRVDRVVEGVVDRRWRRIKLRPHRINRKCTHHGNKTHDKRSDGRIANRSGNSGQYFSVLNWLSEYGLSFDTCGRLCDFVTPSEANN